MQTQVLDIIGDASLRMYVAWVPILPDDTGPPDDATLALVSDSRATHFWDAEGTLPLLFHDLLSLPEEWPAWDVYLAYGRGARWAGAPPAPAFWHHQLGETLEAPMLDGASFASGVRALLTSTGPA